MQLLQHTVGRKILMAITGQLMVLFVIVHLLGNSSIFIGPDGINSYAKHLHDLGPLVWVFRLAMLALLTVHVFFGIQLTLENSAANPDAYAVKSRIKANFSSENMIWTGVLLLGFIVYHVLHFTARVTPDIIQGVDAQGRFDVFRMVTNSFQMGGIALIYVAAMVVLFFHLSHGIQSFFQTMGWSNEKAQPAFQKLGKVLSIIFLLGYSSIPIFIFAGILKG
ncbi:succinate dehydrogenase cytochrome b subunit [Geobacter sp. DSM 9736]|uniref:succinate dehydrogenase cytochrome b subunit n=1 Tax=Geobacter sp. DSM 9736 TaxID=1277350 RepID=UPI000B5141FF|nr:succinate dehydrogenase cytochrome b subunit [Geobacter sp. DSM 9736]SNB46443.1 succinate dehydrogenase subunit C [Geobacter sp. DSM 9736]